MRGVFLTSGALPRPTGPVARPALAPIVARGLAPIALAIALIACHAATIQPPPADLTIEVVGCSAVLRRPATPRPLPVCELGDTRVVRLVLPPAASAVRVHLGPAEADAAVVARDDGTVLTIDIPRDATTVVVDANVAGARVRGTIAVVNAELPWLEEAKRVRATGDLERASAIAAPHANEGPPGVQALARGFLARIALKQGRSDDALPLLREAIDLHRIVDRVSDAADDSFALAFALHQRGQRYTEARAVLDAVARDVVLYPEGRAREPYYRGVLAGETGDRRRALALLREAERHARRLGMTHLQRNARAALALEMLQMGRAREALPILDALEAELDEAARAERGDVPSPCERVEVANNRGWGALLVNEAAAARGEPAPLDVRTPLEHALAIPGCADVYVRVLALANLARLALAEGDRATSERRLAEAKAGVKEPRGTDRLEWLELEARLFLARGRARDAIRVLDEGLALARASVLRVQEWSLLVARADVLEAMGQRAEAIAALQSAEDVLDDATVLVPLGEGRGAFTGGRSRSARALVGLLVHAGRIADAAAVGRRAQARVLSSASGALRLEQLAPTERAKWEDAVRAFRAARAAIDADASGDWKLPADALARAVESRARRERELRAALEGAMAVLARSPSPAPRTGGEPRDPGVLEIDIHPDLRGFVALAQGDGSARAIRVPSPHGTEAPLLAAALFGPLDGALAAASRVRIRAYGAWRTVDVHALAWRGEPLVAAVPVEYAIGLGAPRPAAPGGPAVVVGDPTSDLPAALAEARAAAVVLRHSGDVRLLVREEATSAAVVDALRGAGHLHYAGHGVFAGDEGWESALPLASGGRLTAADVLALGAAPRTVVLTGCEASKSVGDAEGVGLAQAFLVAGSSEVLAPVRPVPDTLAGAIAGELYVQRDGGASRCRSCDSSAARTREAVLAVRRAEPASDWAAFRVLVP